ncbi:MAG: hypothetical protein U5Q44_08035 [Dehalococcoidia bacterium]|nr:hypothetical protein [Dehalococcoidia bacterium]
MFLVLFGALAYWQVFRTDLANSQYNPRVLDTYNDPHRGSILDREGNVLAETTADAQARISRRHALPRPRLPQRRIRLPGR